MRQLPPHDPRQVGPYRIVALLGAGGMGRVYLGLDRSGGAAAVKVVRAEYAYDPDFRERFAREMELARLVHGDYTPRVLAADTSGQTPWTATEYVMGPSLHDLVNVAGPLPEDAVRFLGRGVAQALERVHAHGLVHRDLKPGNVMVSSAGPQVIDFGIAGAMEDAQHGEEGRIIGTPGYMSPESIRQEQGGAASDVFALGGTLVYALTGTGPFGEGHPSAVMYRIANQDPVLTGVPDSLHGLVAACLDKDPARRPTAAQALEALGGAVAPAPEANAWLPPAASAMIDRLGAEYRSTVRSAPPPTLTRVSLSGRLMIAGAATATLALMGGLGVWSVGGLDLMGGSAPTAPEEESVEREVCDPSEHLAPEFTEPVESETVPDSEGVLHPVFSGDGSVLALGSARGILLLDWEDGTRHAWIAREVPLTYGVPAFSPNGCLIALTSDQGAYVYSLENGEHTVFATGQQVLDLAFSPDGALLAVATSGGGNGVTTYDVDTGDAVHSYSEVGTGARHVSYSPDGAYMAAHNYLEEVVVWETETHEVVAQGEDVPLGLGDDGPVLTNDHGEILYRGEEGPHRQNFLTEDESTPFVPANAPEGELREFAVSPQADRLYATYLPPDLDPEEGVLKVWEYSTGEELTAEEDEGYVAAITVHPDGEIFVGFPPSGSGMWVVDAETLRLLHTIN